MRFTSDLHVHTHLSSCGKPEATVEYYREAPVDDIESDELCRERIRMYRIAKSEGCLFTVGVDSHGLGYHDYYHLIEPVAELIGITENDLHPLAR